MPLLVLCGAGAVLVAARRRRDPLSLALAAWLVVTGGFAILGVVTPVEMRANLAAEPLVVILGATTLAAIDGRFGRAGRIVSIALAVVVSVDGLVPYSTCLGLVGMNSVSATGWRECGQKLKFIPTPST